ncbi:MAG: hypothetical protein AAGI17_07745 [Planctomycetota bacterium]
MKTLTTLAITALTASVGLAQTVVEVNPTNEAALGFESSGNSGGGSSGIQATTLLDGDGAVFIGGDRTRYGLSSDASLGNLADLNVFNFQWTTTQEGPTVATAQAPALRLSVFDFGADATFGTGDDRVISLTWEDGEQSSADRQFVAGSGSLNTTYEGDFFGSSASRVYAFTSGFGRGIFDAGGNLIAGSNSAQDLSSLISFINPGAIVFGFNVGVGSSVGNYEGFADRITLGFAGSEATTYNFVIPTPAGAAAFGVFGLAASRRRR